MFVRIIYNKTQLEVTIECKKVSYCPHTIEMDPTLTKGVLFIDANTPFEREVLIDAEEDISVIYMNNDGKTIDHKLFVV